MSIFVTSIYSKLKEEKGPHFNKIFNKIEKKQNEICVKYSYVPKPLPYYNFNFSRIIANEIRKILNVRCPANS